MIFKWNLSLLAVQGTMWFLSSILVWAQRPGHMDSLRVEGFLVGKSLERKLSKGSR